MTPPNNALQRARSAPLRSPLRFEPSGDQRYLRGVAAALVGLVLSLTACDGGIYARGIVQTQDVPLGGT